MPQRYLTRRDLDGLWSVRDAATDNPAVFRGSPLVGKTERVAVLRARDLNRAAIEQFTGGGLPPAEK